MTLGVFDVITAFISGFMVCAFALHKVIRKATLKQHYEQGKLDGTNELWPHLTSAWIDNLTLRCGIAEHEKNSRRGESTKATR